MSLTGLPINKLTDEQFIKAYRDMKLRNPNKGPSFSQVLQFALQEGQITTSRMISLQALAMKTGVV